MTVEKIEIEAHSNPNETLAGLATGVVGTASSALNDLIVTYGGAPAPVKVLIASPQFIGDFVFSMIQEGGDYDNVCT
jgi:predicted CDP-diglyceride synthetase/phosphatidate cytidylyltransferase